MLNDPIPMLILLDENTSPILGPCILPVLLGCSLCCMVGFFHPLATPHAQAAILYHEKICMVHQHILPTRMKW